jgi:hypothetical protein
MKVSIIMPVLNQVELTKICVESIKNNTPAGDYEVIAVDNASTDGSADYLSKEGARVIRNTKNLGVAYAWNQGVKAAGGDYVCIINNDIVASAGWLGAMLEYYEKHPDSGIVSPGTRWGEMDYDFESYAGSYVKQMRGVEKDGYAGWCMLVKKDRFEKAGMFCEDYRVGTCEDTDFYLSLNKAGYKSRIIGDSFVHHFGSRTLKVMRKEVAGFEDENTKKFMAKWGLKPDTYLQRKKKSLAKFVNNAFLKITRGHTLDERRPK